MINNDRRQRPALDRITRITPILWSALGVSATSFLSACRHVMETFSGAVSTTSATVISLSSLRSCACPSVRKPAR